MEFVEIYVKYAYCVLLLFVHDNQIIIDFRAVKFLFIHPALIYNIYVIITANIIGIVIFALIIYNMALLSNVP